MSLRNEKDQFHLNMHRARHIDAARELIEMIDWYYAERGYKFPDAWEALGFLNTELGEVYEVLLAERAGWVRNHPEDKPGYSPERLGEDLGDVVMMAVVAGLARGVNPLECLSAKLHHKVAALRADEGTKEAPQ